MLEPDGQVQRDYERVGFGGSLPCHANTALIVVDMVLGYLDPNGPFFHPSYIDLAQRTTEAVDIARHLGLPVIFTSVLYEHGLQDAGYFGIKIPSLATFTKGSRFAEFSPSLGPQPNELHITKQYASAFFDTTLSAELITMEIQSVFIAGVSTSGCVRATALDALQYGFAPFVLSDLIGDRDPELTRSNLFDLEQKYAEVVSFSRAIELWQDAIAHRST